jgi:serine O-acetyltransferase
MNDKFASDLYRFYGKTRIPILHWLMMPPQLKYLRLLRSAQNSKGIHRLLYKFRTMRMQRKTHIQIPVETKIGKGFYIGHFGRIIIHPKAIIGDNVNIATGVTIGQTNRGSRKGVPVIGNRVWIGTNSIIVGAITIGDDVLIAPNCLVNTDIPSHSVVSGNPATIIHRILRQ